MKTLDAIDRRILQALQRDASIPNTDLAKLVGLSPSPCLRRVKLLEEAGVIERYVALLNQAAIGLKMTLFVRVTLDTKDYDAIENFASEIKGMREVLECHLMAGSYDFLLRVVAADLDDYQRFQAHHLTKIRCVKIVETEIPLRKVSRTTEFPL
ncbi:UNVERIFIED_ORG: DNA-binding Lrp family transcriptional regulator [Variovorax paradoxus]|jgi:DNA-binding Lrp family transcriptional regulator|nr:DNA-binding Lrp family transcriptional regulator [Variovorax paradoxus]